MAICRGNHSEESFGGQGQAVVGSVVGKRPGRATTVLESVPSHLRVSLCSAEIPRSVTSLL